MKNQIPQSRYKPNLKFNGCKEKDGFVCGNPTGKKGAPWWCVAVKLDDQGAHVRDTKDPNDTTLSFSKEEWKAFTKAVKNGEFDM